MFHVSMKGRQKKIMTQFAAKTMAPESKLHVNYSVRNVY